MNQNPARSDESALSRESAVSGPNDMDSSYPEGRQPSLGKIYPTSCASKADAEVQTVPPVAIGLDSTPSTWFELAVDLCAGGHIPHDRFHRAIEAVREAVDRGE